MSQMIFVNLPVADLDRSKEFFGALGYSFNPQFTDDNAACMVISDTIYAMLLVKPFFATFIDKPISDAHESVEVLIALMCDSRDAVDALVDKAVAAGGREYREPNDMGFMYMRVFNDLDGHRWEIGWMDPAAVQR